MAGHGSHWETLYPNVERFASEELPRLLKSLPPQEMIPWSDVPTGKDADQLVCMHEDEGDVRHLVLLMRDSSAASAFLFSAYPFVRIGQRHDVRVSKVIPWEYGVEGQVEGSIEGAHIAFFDPLFFLNRDRYEIDSTHPVLLTALAYDLARAETQTWNLDDLNPELAAQMRERSDTSAPLTISTEGAAAMVPLEGWDVDDFSFQSTVRSISTLPFNDGDISIIQIVPAIPDDYEIEIPLLAAHHNIKSGYAPSPGDDISGSFWLVGTLDGEAP